VHALADLISDRFRVRSVCEHAGLGHVVVVSRDAFDSHVQDGKAVKGIAGAVVVRSDEEDMRAGIEWGSIRATRHSLIKVVWKLMDFARDVVEVYADITLMQNNQVQKEGKESYLSQSHRKYYH
jgi:hypothetical protein